MSCTRWIGGASTSSLLLVLAAINGLLRQVVCLVSGPEGCREGRFNGGSQEPRLEYMDGGDLHGLIERQREALRAVLGRPA